MVYRLFTEFRTKWLSNVASICARFDISFLENASELNHRSLTEISYIVSVLFQLEIVFKMLPYCK